jgi:hypothetical protein
MPFKKERFFGSKFWVSCQQAPINLRFKKARFPTPSQPRIFFLFERAIQLLHCFLKGQPLVKFVCGRKFCYGKEQNC